MQSQPAQRELWSGKVGDEWAAHAARTDEMFRPLTHAVLELGSFQRGERVLDVGCGAGETSLEMARRVGADGSIIGVDVSPAPLGVARSRATAAGLAVKFIEADAGSLNLDQRVDAIFSRFGVMFFEEPVSAFAHIRQQVRESGRLSFVCWRALSENPWQSTPIEAIRPMLKAPLEPPDPDAPGPFAFADEARVRRILHDAGWRNVAMDRWDGDIALAGGGSLGDIADFLLKIGPCARAVADCDLDVAEARQHLIYRLSPLHKDGAVLLPAACWLVAASA